MTALAMQRRALGSMLLFERPAFINFLCGEALGMVH